jgi:hypothetical protein
MWNSVVKLLAKRNFKRRTMCDEAYISPRARFSPFALPRVWPRGTSRFERIPKVYVEGTFGCFKVRAVRDMEGFMACNQLGFCFQDLIQLLTGYQSRL